MINVTNSFGANFPKINSQNTKEQLKKEDNIKQTDIKCFDALSAQGRAQVVMPHRPNFLSNNEFDSLKKEYDKKFQSLPDDIKSKLSCFRVHRGNIQHLLKIISDERLYGNKSFMLNVSTLMNSLYDSNRTQLFNDITSNDLLLDNKLFVENVSNILLKSDTPDKVEIAKTIISNDKFINNERFIKNAADLIYYSSIPENIAITKKIISDERLYSNENFMNNINTMIYSFFIPEQRDILSAVVFDDKLLDNQFFVDNMALVILESNNPNTAEKNLQILRNKDLTPIQKFCIISKTIDEQELENLNNVIGKETASNLSPADTLVAAKFVDFYHKQSLDELSVQEKSTLMRNLVAINSDLFDTSSDIKQMFPLLPATQDEYCNMLSSVVKNNRLKTKELDDNKINEFNYNINNLASILNNLPHDEFKTLQITQEYTKDEFIEDTINKIKNLPKKEQQKVFDYFGFELCKNSTSSYKTMNDEGYSIVGFPIVSFDNPKNITSSDTLNVIEDLRKNVAKFTVNNKIICNNKELETQLNDIIDVLPELRTSIGNLQAGMEGTKGAHQFDVFKHSLKVMQGIIQNKDYNNLNESDKKLILLASLLHDISKEEGKVDNAHPVKSSLDAFYIAQKFKLNKPEEIKLYTLIKNHEWLKYVNTASNQAELEKRLQSVAYDLRHDNLFDMSLIFTHADLKGVSDEFHDTKAGKGRVDFNGEVRSFGESADYYAEAIKKYIGELKVSQPLLPVTKFPSASRIDEAITTVNSDGSTNIKGVYKDNDGLTVLKYNELENEDLEKIGFPKNSATKGILTTTALDEQVNTGNIKFFVHGLDYPNQLAKFDAFSSVDSDALLSVSYAERPESKYRFYRTQGIILDCDTKYVHGGGRTDSGSGKGKNIDEFKKNYIFGGERQSDRNYISDLIKEELNLSDEEYIEFVRENENKSMTEIEPVELRNKLIQAFSSINSNARSSKREYNEMYISNPKPPMAVFAYDRELNSSYKNPLKFLQKEEITHDEENFLNLWNLEHKPLKLRTEFLREYALEHNLPFVVFGN